MFYDSVKVNNGNTMVDYYGEVRFDEDELKAMAEGINKAADFYAARGAKYLIGARDTDQRVRYRHPFSATKSTSA